ncbi:hypothetical protein [uncultured Aquimarina sp.]|uniref:hypothetical protein n=1 Tax=uncultured Aquimarina sp. TaxID=575652 RepID=UPI002606F470|nr:hypothetical protein [uncultured Aquimarina sp.]
MKKITLLLIVAVFVIGIQSCSTEQEEVLLEESPTKVKNNIPENAVHFRSKSKKGIDILPIGEIDWYTSFFVRHPIGTTYQQRVSHADNIGTQIFDDFYVVFDNGCDYVDEWFVLCKGCGAPGTGGETDNTTINREELNPDETITADDGLFLGDDIERYGDCADVPIFVKDTDIIIIDNDENSCLICD